jgi:hypothetical protein
MIQIDPQVIEQKKKVLEDARITLKEHFIGIDSIIDNLLDYIQVWYLLPEILTRPMIVNLWGMTGVGKTDLIRKLVKCLDFQDRFAEIELSNIDGTSWMSSVAQALGDQNIQDENPSIVLFDEIQRFNTIDSDGNPVGQTKFMDFWELLSDGKLSKKSKDDLDYYLYNYLSKKKDNDKRKMKGEEVEDENPLLQLWEARELKKVLSLDNTIDEITEMTENHAIELIKQTKIKKKIYEPVNYAKMLIIISGNLDEAFYMAGETSEADVDADIFHAFTQKITLVDVKNSLNRKFRPEQVARFGNIHLIYTSLRKENFERLIEKDIERIIISTKDNLGISLSVDSSINRLIYRNGVFPVQGVRPVFSSIGDILEANLSKLLYDAIMNNIKSIAVKYDETTQKIIADLAGKAIEIPYTGRIDKIRESNQKDSIANISVHECGHAVVYMALMGLAPLQLKSKVASSYAGGFTFPHQIHETRENLVKKIKIYLAGGLAEELIFGKDRASVGRSHDREQVTQIALEYVRKYGFDDNYQANYAMDLYPFTMNKHITDLDTEKMISRLVSETKEILTKNIALLKLLSLQLASKGTMTPQEISEIAKENGVNVEIKEEGFLLIANYDDNMRK